MRPHSKHPPVSRGFTLIEVLVAMTIFSVGILGLMGMQARAISFYTDAQNRTQAALLADALINNAWVNRANLAALAYLPGGTASATLQPWLNQVSANLPRASASVVVNGSVITVTITWSPPDAGGAVHQHIETATIQNA